MMVLSSKEWPRDSKTSIE